MNATGIAVGILILLTLCVRIGQAELSHRAALRRLDRIVELLKGDK